MSKLILLSWAAVLAVAAPVGVVVWQHTNQWVPVDGDGAPRVSQVLTYDERKAVAKWTLDHADPAIVNRVLNQPGWDLDIEDWDSVPAPMIIEAFQQMEWAVKIEFDGKKQASCLWCLTPRLNPEAYPHYSVHAPVCPIDMVCSGYNHTNPAQEGDEALTFELQFAPVSGCVWCPTAQGWVADVRPTYRAMLEDDGSRTYTDEEVEDFQTQFCESLAPVQEAEEE